MNKKHTWRSAFAQWLPLALPVIILSGLVYAAIQQNYRLTADDPQIQIARDIALAISQGGATPDAVVPATPTQELGNSLATFVTIYDDSGKPLGSSVALGGNLPQLPSGVFDTVRQKGESKFTWQPQPDTRIAAVVTRYTGESSGFVLAGRSIKEIEAREKQLLLMTGIAGLGSLLLSFLATLLLSKSGWFAHHHEHSASA